VRCTVLVTEWVRLALRSRIRSSSWAVDLQRFFVERHTLRDDANAVARSKQSTVRDLFFNVRLICVHHASFQLRCCHVSSTDDGRGYWPPRYAGKVYPFALCLRCVFVLLTFPYKFDVLVSD
jgi:hypothetical protein